MSRAKRRTGRARSRRTPATAAGGSGPSIPIVPMVVGGGIAVVVALAGYLIWQQSQPASDPNSGWAEVEADPAPDLPGEFVNLQEIYDGAYGAHGENATALHVRTAVNYTEDGNTNPPAGGPHWGSSACANDPDESPPFCGPAPWGIYRKAWGPESVVHNMEHAGIVLWHNTTDTVLRDEMEGIIEDQLNSGELLVMMPYPSMEDETIALTSWARIDKFPVSEYSKDRIEDYIDAHAKRFNPEGF